MLKKPLNAKRKPTRATETKRQKVKSPEYVQNGARFRNFDGVVYIDHLADARAFISEEELANFSSYLQRHGTKIGEHNTIENTPRNFALFRVFFKNKELELTREERDTACGYMRTLKLPPGISNNETSLLHALKHIVGEELLQKNPHQQLIFRQMEEYYREKYTADQARILALQMVMRNNPEIDLAFLEKIDELRQQGF
ncbi:MAG: hypothetical protein NUV67_05470 [archaeon]|nr:hypothetical protein [archaeon]